MRVLGDVGGPGAAAAAEIVFLSPSDSSLIDAYLQMRADLGRFIAVRLRADGDAEDLLQELYLKASRTTVADEIRDPRAYLYRLASNLMMDRWRSVRRATARDGAWRLAHYGASPGGDVDDAPSVDAAVDARLRLEALVRKVESLPDRTRKVFRLHKFDGLSYAEVAEREGLSRSAVEKHMMQALRALSERDAAGTREGRLTGASNSGGAGAAAPSECQTLEAGSHKGRSAK